MVTGHEDIKSALAGQTGDAAQLYGTGQAQCANADHVGEALHGGVHAVTQKLAHFASTGKQVFFFKQVQCGNGRRAGDRVAGVGVTVEKLDGVRRAFLIGAHQGFVQMVAANDAAQRDHTIGYALGKIQHVGHHTIVIRGEVSAHTAKAGDHFVKNQQNAVLVANLAQAFQVALGRQVPARAACDRLHNDGGNVAGIVQGQNAVFQLQQDVFLPFGLYAIDVGVINRVVNKAQMVHPWQQRRAVNLAVGGNAAHAHATKTHAVVATLAANEHIAVAFAPGTVVGQGDFHGGIGGFTA